ncbi:MAG TPA: hypothetical protein DCO72_07675 [Ruminococcus sp.]|nr:hypothetical protein [Ruminococcus sp.]
MDDCPNLNQETSGMFNGYQCTLAGHIPMEDGSVICENCNGENGCKYANGDPILTDDIASGIVSEVESAVAGCVSALGSMAAEVSVVAQRTSMESINEIVRIMSNYSFSGTGTYGYSSVSGMSDLNLTLPSEKRIADELDSALANAISQIYIPSCSASSYSANPVVSSHDFDELSRIIYNYGYAAADCLYCSGGGEFGSIAASYLESASGGIVEMVRYLIYQVERASLNYSSALASAISSAQSMSCILMYADIHWDIWN